MMHSMEDLDFDVSGQSGYIIVNADSVECLKLEFDTSIHVQVIFSSVKSSTADPQDNQSIETVVKHESPHVQELSSVASKHPVLRKHLGITHSRLGKKRRGASSKQHSSSLRNPSSSVRSTCSKSFNAFTQTGFKKRKKAVSVSNKDGAKSAVVSLTRTTRATSSRFRVSKASTGTSHSQEDKEEDEMRCTLCGKTFVNRKFYLMHGLRAHVKSCKICKASFETKAHLKRHIREQHLEDKDAEGNLLVKQCAECPYKTLSAENFNRHLQRGHNKNPAPFACEHCPRTYSRKCYYLLHVKNEHGNDPTTARRRAEKLQERLPCDVCGKLIRRKFLVTHKRLYHGPKLFKCNNCPKAFSELHGLKRHMLTHTKEKPYQCEVCSKCFSQSTNLTIHMRTHTKEKPFQCQFCELAFSHKCTLQGHIDRKHRLESLL